MTNRLVQAFDFAQGSDRPHVYGEARAKILELVGEINKVYRTHMIRSTGKVCDICGKGDSNEKHKVRDVVAGYYHRDHASPRLCYNHFIGWNISYTRLHDKRKAEMLSVVNTRGDIRSRLLVRLTHVEEEILSDDEVDLHFAQYLAKQLCKYAKDNRSFTK